jgi:O-antigen/teichoic acid export membrane protein
MTASGAPDDVRRATARRVLANTAAPFAANLAARALSWALAVVTARTLGPTGTGDYAVAVNFYIYAGILADFGLGTWLTREVARRRTPPPQTAGEGHGVGVLGDIIGVTVGARLGLSAIVTTAMVTLAATGHAVGWFDVDLAWTIVLLAVGLIPGAIAASASSVFMAHERMGTPALLSVLGAGATTLLGATALISGSGIVGLGVTSLVITVATAGAFVALARRSGLPITAAWPRTDLLELLRDSVPLMLNNLLNSVFFRIDVQVLGAWGRSTVGQYASAYKIIDGVGGISSSFILALFPMLSRRAGAEGSPDTAFGRVYALALTLLVTVAMPVAGLLTWVATPLSEALWGRAFLPESAIALQILIWFLPLSFVNGLTQYVLIALGLQARITVAFAVAAIFNLVANLVLVPTYGYVAAAATTIATEVVLLVPFALAISTRLPFRPLVMACVRPLPAAMIAGGVLLVGEAAIQSAVPTHDAITSALPAHDAMFEWATVIAAGITYPLALWATRALAPDDLDLMLSVIRRKR